MLLFLRAFHQGTAVDDGLRTNMSMHQRELLARRRYALSCERAMYPILQESYPIFLREPPYVIGLPYLVKRAVGTIPLCDHRATLPFDPRETFGEKKKGRYKVAISATAAA